MAACGNKIVMNWRRTSINEMKENKSGSEWEREDKSHNKRELISINGDLLKAIKA
jgi:hypothetical protein